MKIKKRYKSSGLVYGNLWGGGKGSYPAKRLESSKLSELLKNIKFKIKDGSMDSGMGYESLIGGIFSIETISSINIKGNDYNRSDYEIVFSGKLNKKEREFLIESLIENGN